MRLQRDLERSRGPQFLEFPKVAQLVPFARHEANFNPLQRKFLRRIGSIESRQVMAFPAPGRGGPDHKSVRSEQRAIACRVLIDGNHLRVGQQQRGPFIATRQIPA
jgi:hypothetical protein